MEKYRYASGIETFKVKNTLIVKLFTEGINKFNKILADIYKQSWLIALNFLVISK